MNTVGSPSRPWMYSRLLVGSLALGMMLAVLKGDQAGWRDVVGNLSAPYALPPFLVGAITPASRRSWAVMGGIGAALAMPAGFYLWEAVRFGMVTRHTVIHIALVSVLGVLLGAVFGILGYLFRTGSRLAAGAIGIPFLAEPAVQLLPGRLGDLRGDSHALSHYPYLFFSEVVMGGVVVLLLLWRTRHQVTLRVRTPSVALVPGAGDEGL